MKKLYSYITIAFLSCLFLTAQARTIKDFPYSIHFEHLKWYEYHNETTGGTVIVVDYEGWTPSKWFFEPGLVVTGLDPFFEKGIFNSVVGGYIISPLLDLSKTKDPYLTIHAHGDLDICLSTSVGGGGFVVQKSASVNGFISIKLDKDIKYVMLRGTGTISYARIFDRSSSVVSDFPYTVKFDTLNSFVTWTGEGYIGTRIWDEIEGPIVLMLDGKGGKSQYLVTPELDLSSLNNPCITSVNPMELPMDFVGECSVSTSVDGVNYTLLNTWDIDTRYVDTKKAPEFISIPKDTRFIKIQPYSSKDPFYETYYTYYMSTLQIKEMESEDIVHSEEVNLQNLGALKWESEADVLRLKKWDDATKGEAKITYQNDTHTILSDDYNYELTFKVEGLDNSKVEVFVESEKTKAIRSTNYILNSDGLQTITLSKKSDFTIVARLLDGVNTNEIPPIVISDINVDVKQTTGLTDSNIAEDILIHFDEKSGALNLSNLPSGNYATVVKVYNLQGQLLVSDESKDSGLVIPLNNYAQNIFMVVVTNPELSVVKKVQR